MPDYTIVQGQTLPVFEDVLTYSDGSEAAPESVAFVMRNPTQPEPLTLTGTASVVSKGKVRFIPTAADTNLFGNYEACWEAQISGKTMRFPTEGTLWVQVQPNLQGPALLAGVAEVKQALYIPPQDDTHDDLFREYIEAATPLIENLTGPIVKQSFDEWYEGGTASISLRHKPSYGYGTSPFLFVQAISEYRGPIEYNLSLVPTPTQGSVYSAMVNGELGTIARRTSGGGSMPFPLNPERPAQSVHVVYTAGQETTPANVKRALIETVRWWHVTTQPVGRGAQTGADWENQKPMVALPYHAVAMLEPTRRHPAFA